METSRWTPAEMLWNGYFKDDDDSLEDEEEAMSQSVALIVGKLVLDEQEIVDLGESREPGSFRYHIIDDLFQKATHVVNELQWYLSEASKLVSNRSRYFRLDPGHTLLPLLRGASHPQQIRVAWDLLRARIETGERFFKKYLGEVVNGGRAENSSPASTTSSILEGFDLLTNTEQKMKHFVTYYPRHKEDLSSGRERLKLLFSDWNTVYERRAASASPEQSPFDPPKDDSNITRRQAKTRDSWPDASLVHSQDFGDERTVFSPAPVQPALELIEETRELSPSKPVRSAQTDLNEALLKPTLKYKASTSFLDQMANQSVVAIKDVPAAADEPNVLQNLLSGPLGSQGDRFKSTFGGSSFFATPPTSGPSVFSAIPEYLKNQPAPPDWRLKSMNPFSSHSQSFSTPAPMGAFPTPVTP
ncbi:hypothetical protein C8R46DRAFT_1210776 [Mycena filopes]|nr:hypothetical protein C8R46DRAFT_1210776 [Mycena filopes]